MMRECIYLSTYLSIYLSIYLFIFIYICISIYIYIYLHTYIYISYMLYIYIFIIYIILSSRFFWWPKVAFPLHEIFQWKYGTFRSIILYSDWKYVWMIIKLLWKDSFFVFWAVMDQCKMLNQLEALEKGVKYIPR